MGGFREKLVGDEEMGGWITKAVKESRGKGRKGLRVCHFKGVCWEATGFK